jgi:hypothetical protein
VVGVLYAGLNDYALTLKNKDLHRVPTNISYVVPSHYLTNSLQGFLKMEDMRLPPDAKTIDEMLKNAEFRNILEKGRDWVTKRVDPEAEAARVSEMTRVQLGGRNESEG